MKTLGLILALVLALCAPARGQIAVSSGGGAAAPSRPTFVSAGAVATVNNTANQITLAAPAGIATNDLIVAHVIFYNGTGTVTGFTSSGWTAIRCDNGGIGASSGCLLWHLASSNGDGPWTLTESGSVATDYMTGRASAFRGANLATPIDLSAGQVGAQASTVVSLAVTPTVNNGLLVAFYGSRGGTYCTLDAALSTVYNGGDVLWLLLAGAVNAPAAGIASAAYTSTVVGNAGLQPTETINIRP
jgi:hypothetical protein